MPEVGEEIVGTWLRYSAGCDFVDYNVRARPGQGEIDVVGINLAENTAYICEVATHLRGLGYKGAKETILNKFKRAKQYASQHLQSFNLEYMFWSPVVLRGGQEGALQEMKQELALLHDLDVELVVNEVYGGKLEQLRGIAGKDLSWSSHDVYRLFQIEQRVQKRNPSQAASD